MIDRRAVIAKHDVLMDHWDCYSPLSVGNGEFAFTCDPTGLQTFAEFYEDGMPLCTMAQWGWHTSPYQAGEPQPTRASVERTPVHNGERDVPYLLRPNGQEDAYRWLRENPHRYHLARVGLHFAQMPGRADISDISQRLNLYEGQIVSEFTLNGEGVRVVTCVHPDQDMLAFRIESALLKKGMGFIVELPAPSPEPCGGCFDDPASHESAAVRAESGKTVLLHTMDDDRCFITVASANAQMENPAAHRYVFTGGAETLEAVIAFDDRDRRRTIPTFAETLSAAAAHWANFWESGGFIEIGAGGAPGAELQRRILLSQYLTAIQCAGSLPPAETGLTTNSWYGKYHLEMHWWHAAHFPLWGKPELLERSLWYYFSIVPQARLLAKEQGYPGLRWPKMVGPDGKDAPSPVGPLLIWQQPHPIYYAELLYRANPSEAVLRRYWPLVQETAEFMAAYARYNAQTDSYDLGPGLIPAQENHRPGDVLNPAFELEYWKLGLETANIWRGRMGMTQDEGFAEIARKMSRPAVMDGSYPAHDRCPDTYREPFNRDHPSMTGALGILPGTLIDPAAMSRTLDRVMNGEWQIDTEVWGWDFPMLAMCAARLGRKEDAVRLLLHPAKKNEYLSNGHNKQHTRGFLPLYLPGNGGLLFAAAMMCAGWDGCVGKTPGFPESWQVEWEGLSPCL